MNVNYYLGILSVLIASIINTIAGVGGGGIVLPILVLLMKFPMRQAIGLSNLIIFGGSLAISIQNIYKRHPNPEINKSLICWDIVLIMEPITLLGAFIGAFLGKLLPEIVLIVSLGLILGLISWRTFIIGVDKYYKETIDIDNIRVFEDDDIEGPGFKEKLNINSNINRNYSAISFEPEDNQSDRISMNQNLCTNGHIINSYSSQSFEPDDNQSVISLSSEIKELLSLEAGIPFHELSKLVLLTLLITILMLIKTNHEFNSIINCGGILYWLDTLIIILTYIIFIVTYRFKVLSKLNKLQHHGTKFHGDDFDLNICYSLKFIVYYLMAGLLAGTFGFGGGMIKGPLMLEIGIDPRVSSATSSFMILFTSSSVAISYVTFGVFNSIIRSAIELFMVSIFGVFLGHFICRNNLTRGSFIAFTISGVVFVSAILLILESINAIIMSPGKYGAFTKFGNICLQD